MFYVYDGSFEGFLSALTVVMRHHTDVSDPVHPFYGILCEKEEMLLLESLPVSVIPNILSDFARYIRKNFGEPMTKTIYHAFLSELDGIENTIAEYVFLARKERRDPIDELYHDCVKRIVHAVRLVTGETHRYLGLLRFRKLAVPAGFTDTMPAGVADTAPAALEEQASVLRKYSSPPLTENPLMALFESPKAIEKVLASPEIFVARCEPSTCSLPLIAEHFIERLPNQLFIIFDQRRKLCVIHLPEGQWTLKPYDPRLDDSTCFDTSFEHMWQVYYKVLAIPERINPGLQRGNMPKRYWKHLVEQPGSGKP